MQTIAKAIVEGQLRVLFYFQSHRVSKETEIHEYNVQLEKTFDLSRRFQVFTSELLRLGDQVLLYPSPQSENRLAEFVDQSAEEWDKLVQELDGLLQDLKLTSLSLDESDNDNNVKISSDMDVHELRFLAYSIEQWNWMVQLLRIPKKLTIDTKPCCCCCCTIL